MTASFLNLAMMTVHKCARSRLSQEVSSVRLPSSFYIAVKVGSLFMQLSGKQEDFLSNSLTSCLILYKHYQLSAINLGSFILGNIV